MKKAELLTLPLMISLAVISMYASSSAGPFVSLDKFAPQPHSLSASLGELPERIVLKIQYIVAVNSFTSFRGDLVSSSTHTYIHTNTRAGFKWPFAINRLTPHFANGLASDLVICELKVYDIVHNAECPQRDQASLNNRK